MSTIRQLLRRAGQVLRANCWEALALIGLALMAYGLASVHEALPPVCVGGILFTLAVMGARRGNP